MQVKLSQKESELRYRRLFEAAQDGILILDARTGRIADVNPYLINMLGYSREEFVKRKLWEVGAFHDMEANRDAFEALQVDQYIRYEDLPLRAKNGDLVEVEFVSNVYMVGSEKVIQCNIRNITERKQAESALLESETKFRRLIEHLPTVIYMNPVDDARSTLYISPQVRSLLGYSVEEWLSDPGLWTKSLHPEDLKSVLLQTSQASQKQVPLDMEYRMTRRDGSVVWVHDQAILVDDHASGHQYWQGIMVDITARKQAEETVHEKERLLSEAQRIGRMGSWSYSIPTDILQYTDEMYRLFDSSAQEFEHNKAGLLSLVYAADRPKVQKWLDAIIAGRLVKELDFRLFHKNGELHYLQSRGTVQFDPLGNPVAFTGTAQDISDRKLAEIQIHQQIERLTSLGRIDKAIISTYDLGAIMKMVISQVIAQLQVDAADILLLDPESQTLEYLTGSGFRVQGTERARVPFGRSLAGRAAKEQHTIRIDDLHDQPHDPFVCEFVEKEGFVSYFGVPLISRGKVKGVLEVFHRTSHHPYAEWADFLHTLAGQAAIAIENATLFTNLEQSNRELSQAYDATIVGWSRALDLRDKETEGHTLRVTELTLALAHEFSFTKTQMLHIRWGALLHDIGKMGIPDHILLKPDGLSEDETVIMRKHPQYSHDLLQPIAFLSAALDIPYCHHEKWDGTGYPRGLKGEEIPLTARIFAVVDVWDALCSDRPYRPGWPREKVREYILSQSGRYFDPQIVDVFINLQK